MTRITSDDIRKMMDIRRDEGRDSPERRSLAETRKALHALCERFVVDNEIHCPETIWQMDHVIGNAYEFIEEICNTIGYASMKEDEGGDED